MLSDLEPGQDPQVERRIHDIRRPSFDQSHHQTPFPQLPKAQPTHRRLAFGSDASSSAARQKANRTLRRRTGGTASSTRTGGTGGTASSTRNVVGDTPRSHFGALRSPDRRRSGPGKLIAARVPSPGGREFLPTTFRAEEAGIPYLPGPDRNGESDFAAAALDAVAYELDDLVGRRSGGEDSGDPELFELLDVAGWDRAAYGQQHVIDALGLEQLDDLGDEGHVGTKRVRPQVRRTL